MSAVADRLFSQPAVDRVRGALGDVGADVWFVGGTVRDMLLAPAGERGVADVDLAVDGDPRPLAGELARRLRGSMFALSETFGAWRVLAGDRSFVCDLSPLQAETIERDLARRDFTINALAVPFGGGEVIDPLGGVSDCTARILRLATDGAYRADPLRPLRCARLAIELMLEVEACTEQRTRQAAPKVTEAAPERVFSELRRVLVADGACEGLRLTDRLGLLDAVLPEVAALHGVEQSPYHHLDVFEHTLEVLHQQIELEGRLAELFGDEHAGELEQVLDADLSHELTRGQALRIASLLHDVGKPQTKGYRADGRITFLGHDRVGREMVDAICRRLRVGERLRRYLGALTLHHLVVGFMVHERPLSRRAIYRYLTRCEPVEVELLLLSCADRMATRGRRATEAIASHLDLTRELLEPALSWRRHGPPAAPLRGDELAAALGIERGPRIGELLAELSEAVYAGEVDTAEQAVELARSRLAG